MSFERIRARRVRMSARTGLLAGLVVFSLGWAGCEAPGKPDVGDSAAELSRKVEQLRDEADLCLSEFQRLGGAALEKLECFAEKHRETTKLMQSAELCPKCYLNYGYGLRLLGRYYVSLRQKIASDLDRAPAARVAEYRAALERADEKVRHYFEESNHTFEYYFASAPGRLEPSAFKWASEQYDELGRYGRAIDALDRFLEAAGSALSPAEEDSLREARRRLVQKYENSEAMKARG